MARCPAGHESETSDYCDTCGAVMGGSPVTPAPPMEATALLGADTALSAASPDPAEVCPNCGALRGGRFCEECGFDYELAQLLPPVPAELPAQAPVAGTKPPAAPEELEGRAAPGGEPEGTAIGSLIEAPGGEPAEQPRSGSQNSEPVAQPQTSLGSSVAQGTAPVPSAATPLSVVVTADREYYTAQVERGDIVESEFPFPRYPGERRFALDADVLRIGRASASRGIVVEIDLTGPPLDPAVSHLHAQLLRGADGGWRLVDLGSANGTRLNGAEQPVPVETEVPVKAGDRIHVGVWTTLTLQAAQS